LTHFEDKKRKKKNRGRYRIEERRGGHYSEAQINQNKGMFLKGGKGEMQHNAGKLQG